MNSNNPLNIQKQTLNLGSELSDVREKLTKEKLDANINILALQPGVGKTYKIKNFLKEKDKWVVTVPNHPLIRSEYDDLLKLKGVVQWQGFDKLCNKYVSGNSFVKNLKDKYKLIPSFICRKACNSVEQKRCAYKKQFKKSEKVVTVSSYYNTPYFYEKDKFKFDIALVDEELKGYERISVNKDEIEASLHMIYDNYCAYDAEWADFTTDFNSILNRKDFFSTYAHTLRGNIIFNAIEDDKRYALELALEKGNWNDISIINKLDTLKLKKWLYYYHIYGRGIAYGEPHIYKLFDLARQNVNVIFSDATFSESIFTRLLERYMCEDEKIPREVLLTVFKNKKNKSEDPYLIPDLSSNISLNLLKSTIRNKKLTIYKMWKDNNFYRGNIRPETPNFINAAKRKFLKVGIISYKNHVDTKYNFESLGEFIYFGNLRGMNKFKNQDVVFVIGTPLTNPKEALEDYNLLFVKNEEEAEKPDIDGPHSEVLDLQYFQRYLVDCESYQAIHRSRPFENSGTLIFIFGYLPAGIKNEFRICSLDIEQTKQYFSENFKGIYPAPLYSLLISYYLQNPESKSLDIAKKFKLYKRSDKKNYNTPFITAIKKGEIKPKDVNIINKACIENLETVKKVKTKHNALKIEDKLVKDFLYYAENGNFICH